MFLDDSILTCLVHILKYDYNKMIILSNPCVNDNKDLLNSYLYFTKILFVPLDIKKHLL